VSRAAGLLAVDKPAGLTSHDVVQRIRGLTGARAGHAGTLDPQATGVLLVCLGSATRLARFLQAHDKVYEGVIKLGWATDTYDAEGEPLADPVAPPSLTRDAVEEALASFVGEYEQTPPVYSAKKIRGQPSYRRARRGEDVAPQPVTIVVHSAEVMGLDEGEIRIRIHCGPGTYVRTLAHDLGEALGCPAHLAGLRRTRSGPFGPEGLLDWDAVESGSADAWRTRLIYPAQMLPDWPAAVLNEEGVAAVANGRIIEPGWIRERRAGAVLGQGSVGEPGWVRVLDDSDRMIAAGEMVPGGLVQPRIVLR
jgi:tRNA pseudouridine55 synthase